MEQQRLVWLMLRLCSALVFLGVASAAWLLCNQVALAMPEKNPPKLTLAHLFKVGQLRGVNGKAVQAADFTGKPVMLVFWEAWCSSCKEEAPVINRLYEKYQQKGVRIVGISVATSSEDAKRFTREHQVKYPIFTGRKRMADVGEVVFLPTLLLFDRQGQLSKRFIGAQAERTLADAIEPLLRPSASR